MDTTKPESLRKAELALLAAYRAYDALDKDGADAAQRIRHGELFVRSHPQDRAAGVTLSKLRAAESRAFVAVVQAKTAYEAAHGNDGTRWALEGETSAYLEGRAERWT